MKLNQGFLRGINVRTQSRQRQVEPGHLKLKSNHHVSQGLRRRDGLATS